MQFQHQKLGKLRRLKIMGMSRASSQIRRIIESIMHALILEDNIIIVMSKDNAISISKIRKIAGI